MDFLSKINNLSSAIVVFSIITVTSCDQRKNNNYPESEIENNMTSTELDYLMSHEKDRKLYRLTSDFILRDETGREVAIIYKGALIRDASIFDLETSDIGDNDLTTLVIKSSDLNLKESGSLHGADELGIYGSVENSTFPDE